MTFLTRAVFDSHVAAATAAPGNKVLTTTFREGYIPFSDPTSKELSVCAVFVVRVRDENVSPATEHTVCVGYRIVDGEEAFLAWCGDKFVDGNNMTRADAETRAREVSSMLGNRAEMEKRIMSNFGMHTHSGPCTFWKNFRRSQELCSHVNTALATLDQKVPDFRDKLIDAYAAAMTGMAATAGPVGDVLSLAELAFKTPVLFEGDRGSGKTTTAREFARSLNCKYIEFGGHEEVESIDLLGHLVQVSPSQLVWKDGPLTQAFRKARTEKVVLMLDELLRIPTRQLSCLLTALSPDRGVYRLRTGRITSIEDGVGEEEELECPVENLCVIAATNIGSEYAVDELDPALAERFIPIRMDTELDKLRGIVQQKVKGYGLPEKVAKACMNFYSKMLQAQTTGLVHRSPTTRTLIRAVDLGHTSGADVKRALHSQALLWVVRNSDGMPVAEQVQTVKEILDQTFKDVS